MTSDDEKRIEAAANAILTAVQTLSQYEWDRMVGQINRIYTSKAAKVMLDGSDIELAHKSIRSFWY